jgi:adenylate kinase
MNEEDEAFNEIERRSKVKQTLIVHKSKEAMLTAEVAVLTEMVRAQAKRIAEMETAVLIEREACAKLCEGQCEDSPWFIEAAAAIRARGES